MLVFFVILQWLRFIILVLRVNFLLHGKISFGRRKPLGVNPSVWHRFPKKPEWVPNEIIRMKAMMPHKGCRKLTETFNRRFTHKGVSVGKTYVSNVIRSHQYEILVLRKRLKHRRPRPMPLNKTWAMDLTGKQDSCGHLHNILGIVEYGSRACLCLQGLRNKASITLIRHLLDAVEKYGKPAYLRTDNESVFTSSLFRFCLWLLGIKHQKIDRGCPWMNGRVERFFRTLKSKLDRWEVDSLEQLNNALVPFRFWYNHVRPHSNLDGRTPAEIWTGKDIFTKTKKQERWFEAWDGLLTGYYLRF